MINKIIFNNRLVLQIELMKNILYKVIGGKSNQAAIHLALNKKMKLDISNQIKTLIMLILADASNYYNRISYLLASIIY